MRAFISTDFLEKVRMLVPISGDIRVARLYDFIETGLGLA
jgi:hypothetical protein